LSLSVSFQAIRPYSEETRAIQAVADEFHLRTAVDIINSLCVAGDGVGIPENEISPQIILHPLIPQDEEAHQPVLTTAVYADSQSILNAAAVVLTSENSSQHLLSNLFPVAAPVPSEEREQKEDGEEKND
jgi:hypothetical protein